MQRVLVLQLKRIGDAILTAPALAGLRSALPDAHISLALAGAAASLGPAFSMVNETLTVPQAWKTALFRKFDAVIDFTGTDRSAAIALTSRSRIRAGYAKDVKNWLRRKAYNIVSDASVRDLHTIDLHHALVHATLKALRKPEISPPQDAGHFHAPAEISLPDLPASFVVIHPGTAREEKYWPAANWAEVIRFIQEKYHLPIILTGATDPMETAHLAEIQSLVKVSANLAGQLSLLQLTAVLHRAELVLGVDSAAMHLAAAAQRPQVALFGPTNPYHWRPRHDRAILLTAGAPDGTVCTPRHPKAPMTDLCATRVCTAADSLLSAGGFSSSLTLTTDLSRPSSS